MIEPVSRASIIFSRSQLPEALKGFAEFGWFHPIEKMEFDPDSGVEQLASRVRRVFVELDEFVKDLGLKEEPGVIEQLAKGYSVGRSSLEAEDWEDLLRMLEEDAKELLEPLSKIRGEVASTEKALREAEASYASLGAAAETRCDLNALRRFRRLHAVLVTVPARDVREVKAALTGALVIEGPVAQGLAVLFLAIAASEAERVGRVLRTFEAKQIAIPPNLPQNPAEARVELFSVIDRTRARGVELKAMLQELSAERGEGLLALKEISFNALSSLERVRKPGGMRRFAVVEGYLPSRLAEEFKAKYGQWLIFFDGRGTEQRHGEAEAPPTLLANSGYVKAFEHITLAPGAPRYGEIDPTPIISLVFPIFYGIMFGDTGHGLVLLLFGLFLRARGGEQLRHWGTLFVTAGAVASVVGLLVGEAFGLKLAELHRTREVFGKLRFLHTEGEEAAKLLLIGIIIGMFHLTSGFALDLVKGLKEKHYLEVIALKAPTLSMYVGGIFFGLAFAGAKFNFSQLATSNNPAPLIGLPTAILAQIALPLILVSTILIMFTKGIAAILGRYHEEGVGVAFMLGVIEWLLRIVEYLANTISYTRIGILLIIHSTLMSAVALTYGLGLAWAPAWIIFNLLVMVIEGMLVFIQDFRLHLYEWMTKFYDGSGNLFQPFLLRGRRIEVRWRVSAQP